MFRGMGDGETNPSAYDQTSIQGWIIPQLAGIYSGCVHAYREQKVLGILEFCLEEIRKPWYQHDNMISRRPFFYIVCEKY